MKRTRARRELVKDLAYIVIGAGFALFLSSIGAVDWLVALAGGSVLACFVAGIFFTSAFTIAPASVALGALALSVPTNTIVIAGALGALCGDLLIYFFIRDKFAVDLMGSLKPSFSKHIMSSFHLGFLKWLAPAIGALIIASPLPDEFGLTLLGISRTRLYLLIPISFIMNMFGIMAVVWFATAISRAF